jgi:long-chain fatty acid transport protein
VSKSLQWLVCASCALLGWSGIAEAGGFYTPPHGVRPQGRGGAAVLGTPDMNALWYNPALLAGLGGFHLTVDLSLLTQDVAFTRAPRQFENGEVVVFPRVENQAHPLTIPQLGVASDFGTERLVVALGAFAPNGATARYPEQGPQRYAIVDTEGSFLLTVELAMAYRVTDWLWVGGGFQNTLINIRQVNVVTAWPGFAGDAESPEYDILFEGVISSPFTPSGNLGAMIRLTPSVDVGFSAQLPLYVKDEAAKIKQRLPPEVLFDEATVQGDTVTAELNLPWILRGGVRYHQPRWDVELDFAVELWSALREFRITPNEVSVEGVPGVGAVTAGPLSIPRGYEDALSLRLGGDVELLPGALTLRAGALWEQSAIPTRTLSPLQIDMDKLGLSLGATWQATEGLAVDLAWTHLFLGQTEVRDSVVRQLNPTSPDNTVVVGNGLYEASIDIVGLGLRYDLR